MKSISTNEFESECIPSSDLVRMLILEAAKQGKPITVGEVPQVEGRVVKIVNRVGIFAGGCLALLMVIQVIIWWAKP